MISSERDPWAAGISKAIKGLGGVTSKEQQLSWPRWNSAVMERDEWNYTSA